MDRTVVVLFSIALAVLCWAALDDITTGSEPNHVLEWTIVVCSAAWFGGLAWRRLRV